MLDHSEISNKNGKCYAIFLSNILCHLLNIGPFIRGLLKKIGLIDSKSSSIKITSTTGQDNKVFEHVLDVELKSVKVLNGNL